ncbi:MAG TPA: hypothetical protein VFQ36_24990 [Ktedonobacteraceae bacterium]|nr:hypothetical protein [Ktedonobacteraceae bacterium]
MQRATVFSPRQNMLRRIVLFGTPVVLIPLELGHPLLDHANPIGMLAPIASWWIVLHILLVPLFALMGYSLFLLLQGVHSTAATISRCATVIFVAFEVGYDTAVGLNSGILVYNATALPVAQQGIIQKALQGIYGNPSIVISYYVFFLAGVVAICSAAWALYQVGVPRFPLIVLLGTLFATYSHALPYGPVGTTCFLLAVLWIELAWRRSASMEGDSIVIASLRASTESAP